MRILITGASGYIGSNLLKKYIDSKDEIILFLRKNNNPCLINKKFKVIYGDITDFSSILNAIKNIDKVIYIAGYYEIYSFNKNDSYNINYIGTRNILQASYLYGMKEFIYIGTVLNTYNKNRLNLSLSKSYESTKYLADRLCHDYMKKGLRIKIINPAIVFGKDDKKIIGDLIKRIMQKRLRFTICKDSVLSLVYIDDLIEAIFLIDKKGKFQESYTVSTGDIIFKDLIDLIKKYLKNNDRYFNFPYFLIYSLAFFNYVFKFSNKIYNIEFIRLLARGVHANSDKIKKELAYKPSDLDSCIKKTVEYHLKNKF